ncbi:flagellar basal body-associated FliL family protein [uncultured Pseudosulfitobacter sp.]|uniref:flagellar basal body-associated FliL family protein n=1 Tax=uncultured Pseudosulfitobacter sp. TaxID=2854214 RepID=UPI0030DC74CE|tara:strand:+ start:589 stop:1074 length:486 start_codon:yes stop_codon:yes gene_type:complete
MADTASEPDEPPKKASKLPLILGLLLALVGGGGGFYATFSGLLMGGESHEEAAHEPQVEGLPDVAFVPVEPMIVSLTPGVTNQHLRFRANLEVPSQYQQDVTLLLPRVVDVLNGYLRALELRDLQNPASLTRLRAQMLRRIQIVTGEGRVSDLLIMEFVLN